LLLGLSLPDVQPIFSCPCSWQVSEFVTLSLVHIAASNMKPAEEQRAKGEEAFTPFELIEAKST
jgi:hypothetical protein